MISGRVGDGAVYGIGYTVYGVLFTVGTNSRFATRPYDGSGSSMGRRSLEKSRC